MYALPHQPYLLQHWPSGHLPYPSPHLPSTVVVVSGFSGVSDLSVVELHSPNSDWHPLETAQWSSDVPHQPCLLQHSPDGHLAL